MNTYKQIVYRQQDTALMIVPSDENIQTQIRFVNDLNELQKQYFFDLRDYLLTLVDSLDYCVYIPEIDRLDIQSVSGDVISQTVAELETNNKLIVNNVLTICNELLNVE
ncbi:hypothetical protein UFOVP105_11 [uncultured Caudovirales phage]|uniref:Uncharacterized protein n=1 Tax=uncultured Caudovirales phage TaxID=2100421 RepID=A0A6J5L5V1_9CAUD|nr:hypothetical protein UFOVP105_11 [uncultured Caudovirales phage]